MSLFQHCSGDYAPLFRLLDDYDVHRSCRPAKRMTPVRSFIPQFDAYEAKDVYHLDGELPGVDQNDIEIEFTDPHTLVIKGHADRSYAAGTKEPDNGAEQHASPTRSHQATVEDEDGDNASDSVSTNSSTKTPTKISTPKPTKSVYKYWATERNIGEFRREFTFPARVDQNSVKASLRDGILSVTVPKEAAPKLKKIRIE